MSLTAAHSAQRSWTSSPAGGDTRHTRPSHVNIPQAAGRARGMLCSLRFAYRFSCAHALTISSLIYGFSNLHQGRKTRPDHRCPCRIQNYNGFTAYNHDCSFLDTVIPDTVKRSYRGGGGSLVFIHTRCSVQEFNHRRFLLKTPRMRLTE